MQLKYLNSGTQQIDQAYVQNSNMFKSLPDFK